MNNTILIGRLTRDPELRFLPNSGKAVSRFAIAVKREFSKEKEVDFFNIVVWGKTAENCANHLQKGRLVGINGNLRNNNYEDKNGTKHYTIEVVAQRVEFLDYEKKETNQNNNQKSNYKVSQNNYSKNDMSSFQAIEGDDDIPF